MQIFLKSCDQCDFSEVGRLPRTWWMRLIPKLRHYDCKKCKQSFLAPKRLVEERQWMTTTLKNFRVPTGPGAVENKVR
ncbi:hypothetical protein FN976_06155 [Caenimonas sedimenti]|uniref:Uncharacterized protein n=1 Tax=Caenimonas sedimenti TaxID=2596921 RepID=A0A562ZVE8_9BURK|nr:hypothetical protein [Caenimonas sedimenti]TWO72285.1 hypothetical protein FN976_06155 [Caenimonas sedimenti]